MKKNPGFLLSILMIVMIILLCGCSSQQKIFTDTDKTFEGLDPFDIEEAYDYKLFFQPKPYGLMAGYVGDTMPYFEDGIYYIYYLKEAGGSFNHSIYLTTTKDFVTYSEVEDPILEANYDGGQDGWIGTGSVVKVGNDYYFFYTAHTSAGNFEFKETIRAAKGSSPTAFEKIEGWELIPPENLGQKNDFRDPQAYYDVETNSIILTVTAAQDGIARILKFTLSSDLSDAVYDGIIFTDPTGDFWNLECSDTFCLNGHCYLTYSGQDDTLWYAVSDNRYGPYSEPTRIDDKLFYAAKHVENAGKVYMVGWARRSESLLSSGPITGWGGNLLVQQVGQNSDGSLWLETPKAIADSFAKKRPLLIKKDNCTVEASDSRTYTEAFTAYERFLINGKFSFTGSGPFGLAFDFQNKQEENKLICLNPSADKIELRFGGGENIITETAAILEPGKTYSFTYIQEGSVGVFYLDGEASLTVRLYGVSGKPIRLFAENNNVTFTELKEQTN